VKTALCFTPDAAFFRPALYTAASLITAGDSDAFDIFIVCQAEDVAEGFDALDPTLRAKIHLLIVDFAPHIGALAAKGRFSRAVFRRLFLDRVIPERYERIVYLDADMKIVRKGLSQLATLDFGGKALAASVDMIFYMDFRGGALASEFQAYRRSLGLSLDTLYFNTGLMAIDRAEWRRQQITERALAALSASGGFAFMEQSALNKALAGDFAALSPRFNFMGDFLLLNLEKQLAPVVLHFVNRPKPWDFADYRGEARFASDYKAFFASSPWPDWPTPIGPAGANARKPSLTPARRRFREALLAFLKDRRFVDEV
jgi:lipopolysaccharide biosynthesis glycosyltransferase